MAAVSVLTLKNPIVPLITSMDYAYLQTVKVEHRWTSGQAPNERERSAKHYLPVVNDPSNKELLLYVVDQFLDAADNERLHLLTGTARYTKFRAVLGGDLRIRWQAISAAANNKTVDSFAVDVGELLATYLPPSSFEDQKEYLREASKPYSMDCDTLASRLRVISSLCKLLPGSDDNELFASETAFKRAFFALMPTAWRIKFVESGQVLDGDTFTYTDLVRFMSVQEAISKRSVARGQGGVSHHKRKFDSRGDRSGRGGRGYHGGRGSFGRSGSSFGRGYGSYGRGRGNSGGYVTPSYTPTYVSPPSRGGFQPSTPGRGGSSYGRGQGGFTPRTPYRSGGGRFQGCSGGSHRGFQPSGQGGRGPTPYVPNFYAETHDQFFGHDQYYGQDQFFGQEESFQGQEQGQDQFFGHEEPPQEMYFQGHQPEGQVEDQYHMGHQEQGQGETTTEEKEDVHWLDSLGF